MMKWLQWLASTRLTLVGMVILAIGAGLSYDNPVDVSVWALAAPLVFLAINLFAAILTQPGINRRKGLLLFHIGLLSICVLAAIGQMSVFEARIEMGHSASFEMTDLVDIKQGPWHGGELDKVRFVQGGYTVDYSPNLSRGPTRSHVTVPDDNGAWEERVVGDDTPLIIQGYRFYTSFNKGFSAVITWRPSDGEAITGSVNMPPYPLFEYKQDNRWTPPGEDNELKLWLRLETGYDLENDWVLDARNAQGMLVVNTGDTRFELSAGESVDLERGTLTYEYLSSWMGYKVFYDPTLIPLFIAAMLTVFGLFFHYWGKFSQVPMSGMNVTKSPKSNTTDRQ